MSYSLLSNDDAVLIPKEKHLKIITDNKENTGLRCNGRDTLSTCQRASFVSTAESQDLNRQLSDIFLGRTTLFEQEGMLNLGSHPFKASWCSG